MSTDTKWESQEALIAVGLGQSAILGYRGIGFANAMTNESGGMDYPHEAFPMLDYPKQPGVYLWSGVVTCEDDGSDYGPTFGLDGTWNYAHIGDMDSLLGIADPPIGDPEDGPDDTDKHGY